MARLTKTSLTTLRRIGRIIVTHDLGFANIITYPIGSHVGIIAIRTQNFPPKVTAQIVCSYVEAHTDELPNALVILSPGGARVRRA